ncbi:MAG: hypothetical protein ACT4RN_12575 [Pseudonocardia sp.]
MDTDPEQRGPVYDDAMKILTADDLDAVLSLVGVRSRGAEPLNVELAGSRRVDLLARTGDGLVHVEFVKDRSPDLDVRMVEYWARIRRRERGLPLRQFVLVLGDGVPVPDRCLSADGLPMLAWTVVRVADLDPAFLLRTPTTAAVAALAWGDQDQRMRVLVAAAGLISAADPDRARSLLDAAATLGSIVLPRRTIDIALRGADMPIVIRDTPLGRELVEEGRQEGRHEGLQEGLQEGERQAVLRLTRVLLRQRFGDDPRIDGAAHRLAELPDEERVARIAAAGSLQELTG